tara:strand:- start:1633 stop:2382 length:750 start_codon:yes stop_codon:yes gene_type:complete
LKKIFKLAKIYDAIYKNKNYQLEASSVNKILNKNKKIKNILELGSGTGQHAKFLCNRGYSVQGIDSSIEMIANSLKIKNFKNNLGDIRHFNLNKKFDAAISLFHVFSYLNSNKDVISTLMNVNKHLKKNSYFIFDFWYLPAVLNLKPQKKNSIFQNFQYKINRKVIPKISLNKNIVEVNYTFKVNDKKNRKKYIYKEKHSMRYFSINEIELFCKFTGFELIYIRELNSNSKPSEKTWAVHAIIKKNKNI